MQSLGLGRKSVSSKMPRNKVGWYLYKGKPCWIMIDLDRCQWDRDTLRCGITGEVCLGSHCDHVLRRFSDEQVEEWRAGAIKRLHKLNRYMNGLRDKHGQSPYQLAWHYRYTLEQRLTWLRWAGLRKGQVVEISIYDRVGDDGCGEGWQRHLIVNERDLKPYSPIRGEN